MKRAKIQDFPSSSELQMDEDKHNENNNDSFRAIFIHFATNTTAHGFSNILLYGSITLKLFWMIAIISCQVGLWIQIKPLVNMYMDKPTRSKIWLKREVSPLFPMVAVCNTNMVKSSLMPDLKRTDEFIDLATAYNTNLTTDWYLDPVEDPIMMTENPDEVQKRKKKFEVYQRISDLLLDEDDNVFTYGYSFEETFSKCTWKGVYNCLNKTLWRTFWHWKYGTCFAFNTGQDLNGNSKTIVKATSMGMDEGLTITLIINQDQYDTDMTDSVGIVLYVGEQGQNIDLQTSGYSLAPGFTYYAVIQRSETKRADPFKNKSCNANTVTDLGKRANGDRIVKKYSTAMCQDVCVAEHTIKKCNCTSYTSPSLNSTRTCKIDDLKCSNAVEEDARNKKLPCLINCRFPCDEVNYNLDITGRKFPSIMPNVNDMVKVQIYYRSFESQIIEEVEYYKIENLLGDIGGQMGLWSGMSVLTCIEVLFFLAYGFALCVALVVKKLTARNLKQ